MGKTSDWALEVEEQEQIMQELTATHAETVEKVEKIWTYTKYYFRAFPSW